MDVALSGGAEEADMSEQALEAMPSGTSSKTGDVVSGRLPLLAGGKADSGTGNKLPVIVAGRPDMARLAQELNAASRNMGNDLRFHVDLDEGPAVLLVIDRETGEIIRQIPQEKATLALSGNGSVQIRLMDDLV
jgi:FlaG protein